MVNLNIAQQRLHNQLITQPKFTKPDDVTHSFCPIQAQDYAGAKWALGLRMQHASEQTIEQACNDGTILRTHLMRPTWHFVAPADIRWILALTAPRVNALTSYYYRKLELDDAFFARSNTILEKALEGGKHLTRSEIKFILAQAGIATDDMRLTHILMRAELDMVICSGARHGKQFTYALLAERAPHAHMLAKSEALAELARRYFTSRGPAALEDFVWWSGLTTTDAKIGLEMIRLDLIHERIEGKTYWFSPVTPPVIDPVPTAHFLPPYDEYTIAYKDRSAVLDANYTIQTRNGIFSPIIIVDGLIVGTWKRAFNKDTVLIEMNLFSSPTEKEISAISNALEHYGAFLGMLVENVSITAKIK